MTINPDINNTQEPRELTKQEAHAGVIEAWQEMAILGNNDTEHSRINDILKRLEEGTISPNDAVKEARGIEASKIER